MAGVKHGGVPKKPTGEERGGGGRPEAACGERRAWVYGEVRRRKHRADKAGATTAVIAAVGLDDKAQTRRRVVGSSREPRRGLRRRCGLRVGRRYGLTELREKVRVAAPLQRASGTGFDKLGGELLGDPRVVETERCASLVAPSVARNRVAVAQDLVKLLLDRDGALVVQHHVFGGLAAVGVEGRLRVGEDEHLANPETELRRAGTVLGAILQDGEDLVEECLSDERLGLLAVREGREIFILDALVLFIRGKPRNVTRAIGDAGAILARGFELRNLNVEGIVRGIRSGHSSIARVRVQSTKNTFQTSSRVRLPIVSGHRRRQAADRPIIGSVCHSLNKNERRGKREWL